MKTVKKQKNLFAWNDTIQKLFELRKKADRKREIIKRLKGDQKIGEKSKEIV